jgi:hypothetical protein
VLTRGSLAVPRHSVDRRIDRIFYTGMSAAILAAVFVGFAPTFYLRPHFQTTPLAPLLRLHGLVFTAWILLLLTQTTLVAARRTDLHRRLGLAGAALAVLMVAIGLTTAIVSGRRDVAAGSDEAFSFLTTPFADMLVFLVLVAAGIRYRRWAEIHKRLMLLATISILDAAVARWPLAIIASSPIAFFVLTDVFIAVGIVYDLVSRRRVHPAYIWGGALIVASQPLRLLVGQTDGWRAVARMILQ